MEFVRHNKLQQYLKTFDYQSFSLPRQRRGALMLHKYPRRPRWRPDLIKIFEACRAS